MCRFSCDCSDLISFDYICIVLSGFIEIHLLFIDYKYDNDDVAIYCGDYMHCATIRLMTLIGMGVARRKR